MTSTAGGAAEEGNAEHGELPPEVLALAPRMREIATIVYSCGTLTIRKIQEQIGDPLTIFGIRTLLNRLIRRGIVRSRRSGRHSEVVYLPGIVTGQVRRTALCRLVDDRFDGSVKDALITAMQLSSKGLRSGRTGP